MPIKIPNALPAKKILESENIFVMPEERATTQRIRPLKLLIVNLMPTKIVTETQLLRLLSNSPLQIEVDWLHMESHISKNTSYDHLLAFYHVFDEIKDNKYDGMIVTGAPVEKLEYEEVDYWDEFKKLLEWSKTHVFSTFYICWASMAALYYWYGIKKKLLDYKLSGVFVHETNIKKMNRKILRGFDYTFYAPHSRYTTLEERDILKFDDLDLLAKSKEAGPYLIADTKGSRFFVTGHSEYDPETLYNEYIRDVKAGINPDIPVNYFEDDDPSKKILVKWKSHAYLLFSNWLNYYVYQNTPYDINEIGK